MIRGDNAIWAEIKMCAEINRGWERVQAAPAPGWHLEDGRLPSQWRLLGCLQRESARQSGAACVCASGVRAGGCEAGEG